MSDILEAVGTATLILLPVVVFMIVVSIKAANRGEENSPSNDH